MQRAMWWKFKGRHQQLLETLGRRKGFAYQERYDALNSAPLSPNGKI